MRSNRWTVQPFLDVRVAVLAGTWRGYCEGFIPSSDRRMTQVHSLLRRDLPRSCISRAAPLSTAVSSAVAAPRPQRLRFRRWRPSWRRGNRSRWWRDGPGWTSAQSPNGPGSTLRPQRGGARCLAGRAETRSAITSRAAGPRDARCGGSCSQRSKRSDMPRSILRPRRHQLTDPRLLGDPGDRFRYLARGDMRRTRSVDQPGLTVVGSLLPV